MGKYKDKNGTSLIGDLLRKAAPHVVDMAGDVFPPAKILSQLIDTDPKISEEDKMEFHKLMANEEERERFYALENTQGARDMYGKSKDIVDVLAMRVMNWNLPLIFVLIILQIVCTTYLDNIMLGIVGPIIGMVLNKLFEERSVVMNFYFGAMKKIKETFNKN